MRINLLPFVTWGFFSLVGHLTGAVDGALIGLTVGMGITLVAVLLG